MDPPLHCNKFAAKVVGKFQPKRMVMYVCMYEYLMRNCFKKLEKHILGSLILLNCNINNHSSLRHNDSQVIYSLLWEAKSEFPFLRSPFNPYVRKFQNIIVLLHLSITYFIWSTTRYTMKRRCVPHRVTRCTELRGVQRSSELALRSTDFHASENLIFPALYILKVYLIHYTLR